MCSLAAERVELTWKDYGGYPECPQGFPRVDDGVSIFNLLLKVGSEVPWYIWGWWNAPLRP